jgi:tRNA(Ile)-lysidine synthetase-like protein
MKARATSRRIALAIDWPKGIKPTGGKLQFACREQRYTLLDQAARQHGIDTMLVGHHLNDQAETLLLRLSRSTGLRGLSAMRAVVPLVDYGAEPHIALWRPSLDIRKRELIAYCQAHSLEWIHDPSNDNFHFRRVYARRLVDTLETAFDCPPEEFAATSRLADTLDQVLEHAATEFLDNYGTYREPTSASRRRWQSRDSQTTADFIKSQDAKPTLEPIMVAGDIFLSLPSQVAIRVLNRYDESLSSGAALAFIRTAHDRRKKFHERVLPELIVPLNSQFAIRFLKPRRYSQAPYKRRAVRVMAPRYPDSRQYDTRNESSNN